MAYTPTGWAEPLLKKHMLFSSIDVDEARAEVSQVLNDHQLQPSGASVAARLHGAQVDSLTVCMLEYGQEVSVETQPAEDFILVQMALTGQVSVECTEGQWVVRPGQGLIMPSKTPLRLRWQEGARQLILKIPLSRLYAAYHGLTGEHPRDPVTFNRELPLTAAVVVQNRSGGPEAVIEKVVALSPDGFDDVDTVLPYADRKKIVEEYATLAGFSQQQLNC